MSMALAEVGRMHARKSPPKALIPFSSFNTPRWLGVQSDKTRAHQANRKHYIIIGQSEITATGWCVVVAAAEGRGQHDSDA